MLTTQAVSYIHLPLVCQRRDTRQAQLTKARDCSGYRGLWSSRRACCALYPPLKYYPRLCRRKARLQKQITSVIRMPRSLVESLRGATMRQHPRNRQSENLCSRKASYPLQPTSGSLQLSSRCSRLSRYRRHPPSEKCPHSASQRRQYLH